MCIICEQLLNKKMTLSEAEDAARELVIYSPEYLRSEKRLEHTISLIESIEDLNPKGLLDVITDSL